MGKDIEPRRRFEIGRHKNANPLPGVQETLSVLEQLPNIINDQNKLDLIAQTRAGLEEVQDLARTMGVELVPEPAPAKKGVQKLLGRFSKSSKSINEEKIPEELPTKPENFGELEIKMLRQGQESIKTGNGWRISHPTQEELRSLKDLNQSHFLPDRSGRGEDSTPWEIVLESDSTQIQVFSKNYPANDSQTTIYVMGNRDGYYNSQPNFLTTVAAYRLEPADKSDDSTVVKLTNSSLSKTFFVKSTETGKNSRGEAIVAIDIFEPRETPRFFRPPSF